MSEGYVIEPILITDEMLVSSTLPEDDYPEWVSGASYAVEDTVIVITDPTTGAGVHKIYACVSAHTAVRYPPDWLYDETTNPNGKWIEISATNRWKMFDQRSGVASTGADSITIEIAPGAWLGSISLINCDAASIEVVVTDPTDGVVFEESINTVDLGDIVDFYSWHFAPLKRKTDFILNDLPRYVGATVSITFTYANSTVSVGEVILGNKRYIGQLLNGYSFGIRDYSSITIDEWGNPEIIQGSYADTATYRFKLPPKNIYWLKRMLASYRAMGLVWVGEESLTETFIYAMYDDFMITAQTTRAVYASLSLLEIS